MATSSFGKSFILKTDKEIRSFEAMFDSEVNEEIVRKDLSKDFNDYRLHSKIRKYLERKD